MIDFLRRLVDTSDFPARWHCGNWTAGHGWLHISSDLAVFGAYVSIPFILVFVARKAKDLPLPRVFWLFALFIFACGATHLVEATLFWHPWYRLSGVLKALTAVVSWLTVLQLAPLAKKLVKYPSLAITNERLQAEIEQRRRAQAALQLQAQKAQEQNAELQSFSNSVVSREARVIELKLEVNELLEELERSPRYSEEPFPV